MWIQSYCRKRRRPLNKDLSCSSSLLLDIDSEGDAQEENLVWVDNRGRGDLGKLNIMVFLWRSTGKNAVSIQNLTKTCGHELGARIEH
ncbi:hypothetical protein Hanom_Chr00s008531g01741231 [Helianthus anomalus]